MLVHNDLVNGLGQLTEAARFRQAQAEDRDALNELMALFRENENESTET